MTAKKVVAKVDGSEIYQWQLDDTVVSYCVDVLKKHPEELSGAEYDECRQQSVEKLIGGELFYLEALTAGLDAAEDEVNANYDSFMEHFPNADERDAYLAQRGVGEDDLKAFLKKQIIKDRFIAALMERIPPLSKEDIDTYYQKVRDRISLPPRLTFSTVYVENPTEEEREAFKNVLANVAGKKLEPAIAEKILADAPGLIKEARFLTYADKPADELPPRLVQLLYSIEDGSFTEIFEAPHEISLFYMTKKVMNVPMTEADGRIEAEKYLKIVRLKKLIDAYINSLKETHTIEVLL